VNYSVLEIDSAEERARHKVIEPQHMTKDEVLQWYMEQTRPFRRRHIARIRQLSELLMIEAITAAIEEAFPHTYEPKAVVQ
jgi:hypothetical protein